MSSFQLIKSALRDLGDDVAFHSSNLVHGAFDLVCLLALGLVVYASSIDTANAGLEGRALFGVRASVEAGAGVAVNASHAPSSCHMNNDLLLSDHRSCITAMVLEPLPL